MAQPVEWAALCNTKDEIQATLLAGILENNGIACMIKKPWTNTYHGNALLFGAEVCVPSTMLEQAKELYKAYFSGEGAFHEAFLEEAAAGCPPEQDEEEP